MTIRIEKLHEPQFLLISDGYDAVDQFLKMVAISDDVERSDVIVGGRKRVLVPGLVESCVVRAFEGQATSTGEMVLKGLLQGATVLNALSYFPNANENGELKFPVNVESSFQILSKLSDSRILLAYAVIRFL